MRRFVIYGAGAIGGVIGARLFQHGHEVVLIARGAHREAIARDGLLLETMDGPYRAAVPVVGAPAEIDWREDDVVFLTMKGQDTDAALDALEASAPPSIAVACAQNGVDNERLALRRFANVYSIVVQLPATHLEPGVVVAHSAPCTGSLDIGRFPPGVDEAARGIAAALAASTFSSDARADIIALEVREAAAQPGQRGAGAVRPGRGGARGVAPSSRRGGGGARRGGDRVHRR